MTTTRLAVDIGGTFTDVVLDHDGRRTSTKVLTTAAAPERGFLEGARRVLGDEGAAVLVALGFEASEAATVRLAVTVGPVAGRAVLVVGLGPASKVTPETLRRAAGAAVRAAGDVVALATDLATLEVGAGEPSVRLAAVVEGLLLGDYRYDAYRSKPSPRRLTRAVITGVTDGDAVVERVQNCSNRSLSQ